MQEGPTIEYQHQKPDEIGRYKIIKQIGQGSFGTIYHATAQEEVVAVKTESINNVKPMLFVQYQIYQELNERKCTGIPLAIEYKQQESFSFMAMELLEFTLDKYLYKKFGKNEDNLPNLPLDIHLILMNQTLKMVQMLHEYGYLYRDVKPANFMLKSPYDQVFLIDFGLCKKYQKNNLHIPMKTGKKLVGTPLFCSRKTHQGIEQSRRDDIQSWFLMSLYFKVELPWEKYVNRKDLSREDQYSLIGQTKNILQWEKFIKENTKLPKCMISIFNLLQKIEFTERPNYEYLHALISDQYRKLVGRQIPSKLDWEPKVKQNTQIKKIKINFKAPTSKQNKSSLETKEQEKQNIIQ